MFPYIMQGNNVTIVVDGKPQTINDSHVYFDEIMDAIRDDDEDAVREMIDVPTRITNYSRGRVTVDSDVVYWDGEVMHNALSNKIVSMLKEGFDITPLANFMTNLMLNPSSRAVTELYGFLEKGNMPITSDGCFLAYKKVRDDYKDVHSGTFDNSVGQRVRMERNQVDDVADNHCSNGLHFCSLDYLSSFGGDRVMILKINPANVVSIPTDYNLTKGRTCAYEVIGEVEQENAANAFNRSVMDNHTDGEERRPFGRDNW